MASLAGAALFYAERGWLVFPLVAGTKVPATPNGFKSASMDPDTIRAWWAKWPAANIGLVTGHYHTVVDVDGEDGIRSIAAIEDEGHLPVINGIVSTPRGYHIYIPATTDGNATGIRPGIDVRSIGGYVVAPPSTVNGATYVWTQPLLVKGD